MTTFIIRDVGKDTYGAIVYVENKCVWTSDKGLTIEEAQKRLDEWLKSYNWEEGAKA